MKQHGETYRSKSLWVVFTLMSLFSTIASLVGCSPSNPSSATVAPVSNDAEHNQYVKQAGDLITPYMRIQGVPEKPTNSGKARADINRGMVLLQAVLVYNPTNWSSWWVLGKAHQALGEAEKACDAFGKSYAIQKENPDVAREYMFECLEIGRIVEAISAAEHAVILSPQDAGLYANLALAYTLASRITDAQSAIGKSLQIDPNDKISLTLRRIVREIADGKRKQPRTMRELEGH
jgi:tetratricopeptide (TPR) repeat protein